MSIVTSATRRADQQQMAVGGAPTQRHDPLPVGVVHQADDPLTTTASSTGNVEERGASHGDVGGRAPTNPGTLHEPADQHVGFRDRRMSEACTEPFGT